MATRQPTDTETDITADMDNRAAREACAAQGARLQQKVAALHAAGQHAAAEALTLAWETADQNAPTWGACYLALAEL